MTPVNFAALIRYRTKTNATTFPSGDIILLANAVKTEIVARITDEVDEDYFGQIATTDLVANQREYAFPGDMLNKIKYLEIKFDPTIVDRTAWIKLDELDLTTYDRTTDEAAILAGFSNHQGKAKFDIYRGSLWIYSGEIIDSTDGLKLYYTGDIADLSDLTLTTDMSLDPTSTSFGMPKSLHELWARRVQIEYKQSQQVPIPLSEKELVYDRDLDDILSTLKNLNLDRAFESGVPRGQDVFNDGFDL